MSLNRVLFAGGGTGGHVYMAVAVAQALKERSSGIDLLFAGTEQGLEARILPPLGFNLRTIEIGGLKNVGLRRLVTTGLQLIPSIVQSLRIVREFRPSLVVGVGGYSSGPLVLATRMLRIPALLLEPNVLPGFTNRLLRRWCQGAAVAYEETARWFGKKARITGIPIREQFFSVPDLAPHEGPLEVLVFGGSQGSRPINELVVAAAHNLSADRFSLVHQTGPRDFERISREYSSLRFPVEVVPYIDDMPLRFEAADLIISRSGASTIAEITAAGRPSILIPFPHAADDHQKKNAEALESRGAAILFEQVGSDPSQLAAKLVELDSQRERLAEMGKKSRSLAKPNAVARIIQLMEETVC
ncbi:MAG: undecaprenyldiphospho-muramoylpentapeptide beta-N-acetylglucosaminyltransferase [Acidobacteriota bacterium]|nr:MAG: undecaprenyldiphospho-muramoylpentapeptide beta-N-acetylglucosaminyltransferase [Acidobacteriota bacterium]